MRIASFFSGIGGLELGLERALDAETVFQCERDPYARQVLEQHWPGVPRHDDITTLRPEDIPHADAWCGGFPCQDISLAGKGEGLDGDRSGLWWTWFTLVLLVRPRVVVLENVAALRVRGLDDVLRCLAEAGLDAEWDTVGAWEVGAPHRRDRMFIIGVRRDAHGEHEAAEPGARGGPASEPGGDRVPHAERDQLRQQQGGQRRARGTAGEAEPGDDGAQGAVADADGARQLGRREQRSRRCQETRALADTDGGRREGERQRGLLDGQRAALGDDSHRRGGALPDADRAHVAAPAGDWWAAEPNVGRVAHGVPARVDRLRCLGNAVVPAVAYVVGLRVRAMLGAVA